MLADRLGFASPRHLMREITPDERLHWLAYLDHVTPSKKEITKEPEEEVEILTPEQLAARLGSWASGHNEQI